MAEKQVSKSINLCASQEQIAAIKALYEERGWKFDVEEEDLGEKMQECEFRPVDKPEKIGSECPQCICDPCITHAANRQSWWPERQHPPRDGNSNGRKHLYKKFWSMLSERGLWVKEIYLTRKRDALARDPNRKNYVYHRRELIPSCVLRLVRNWLPNDPKKPYMGHMWE